MTDFLGMLALPVPVPTADETVADPFLDLLGAYLMAAINADTKAAWAAVHPAKVGPQAEPMPVSRVRKQEPRDGDFQSKQLPALFVFRKSSGSRKRISQDTWLVTTLVHILWIPPKAMQNTNKVRTSFTHAIECAIDKALIDGRHPAWVKQGDTDPEAAEYGSSFYKYAKLYDTPNVLKGEDFELRLPSFDDPKAFDSYDCFLVSLEIREQRRRTAEGYAAFEGVETNITINDPALHFLEVQLYPSLVSVDVSSGPAAGGTVLTIVGKQLTDGTSFTLDGIPLTDVERVDAETFTAKTGARGNGGGGPFPLIATSPSGQSASLLDAFTYV